MLYAQVVFGLAVSGPFDYIVPQALVKKIRAGSRVKVSFGRRMLIGYVVGLTHTTRIKKLKPIAELIDPTPVLNKNILKLTKWLSDYYCCCWGEAIETALPEALRRGLSIPAAEYNDYPRASRAPQPILLQCLDRKARWDFYLKEIRRTMDEKNPVIMLLPDMQALYRAKEDIISGLDITPALLYRKQPKELDEWLKIKGGESRVVLGTRAAIFAPLENPGLIIIDEEGDFAYKQDQVPHYHARETALKRAGIDNAQVILGGSVVSLESFYLSKKGKIRRVFIHSRPQNCGLQAVDGAWPLSIPPKAPRTEVRAGFIPCSAKLPQVDILPPARRRGIKNADILSRYTLDSIAGCLASGKKILIFLNRKGFATFAYCHNCGLPLKCPRCAVNLVYYFQGNTLNCHYCNFKMQPPEICPSCNAGYIKYSGLGTEKIESELARIFPQARIAKWNEEGQSSLNDADIFVAGQKIIKVADLKFGLIVVMAVDNSLNHIDFRSAERTFATLNGLLGLTDEKIIIETYLGSHHCFKALKSGDINLFYDEELRHRKQLNFPPYRHLGLVKLRGKDYAKVKEAAEACFNRLTKGNKDKFIKILSINPGHHPKLRGNFYWQILFSSTKPKALVEFLKINLKDFRHSGIIVTVDIDPI